METQIIKTEIQGIEAQTLLGKFESLENQIKELQTNLNSTPKTELLTRKETADLLGVSLQTVHNWTRANVIKAYRIGNQVRYKKAELLEALQSQTAKK